MSVDQRAAPTDGVVADPATISVTNMAPGVVVRREVVITNDSDTAVTIAFESVESGPLAAGPNPLVVSYEWDSSQAAACGQSPAIPAGSTLVLDVVAAMPAEAGNEYQQLDATSDLTFTSAQIPETECATAGGLPDLGPGVGGWGLAAVLLVAGGVALVQTWRGRRGER